MKTRALLAMLVASSCSGGRTQPADAGTGQAGEACLEGGKCAPGLTCALNQCWSLQQPTYLAATGSGMRLAIDATSLYWIDFQSGTVERCAKDDCQPTMVASGQYATDIAVDGTNVYWAGLAGNGTIVKCPLAGCATPTTLAPAPKDWARIAVDATSLYWTDRAGGAVMRCDIAGCGHQPTVMASGETSPVAIAVNADSIFWGASGALMTCQKSDCANTIRAFAATDQDIWTIVLTGTDVFWANGKIQRCPLTGCAGAPVVLDATGSKFTIDGSSMYWATGVLDSGIEKCALPDCSNQQVLAVEQSVSQIVFDDRYVYWANDSGLSVGMQGAVKRLPK